LQLHQVVLLGQFFEMYLDGVAGLAIVASGAGGNYGGPRQGANGSASAKRLGLVWRETGAVPETPVRAAAKRCPSGRGRSGKRCEPTGIERMKNLYAYEPKLLMSSLAIYRMSRASSSTKGRRKY